MPGELREPKIKKEHFIKVIFLNLDENGNEKTKEEEQKEEKIAMKLHSLLNTNKEKKYGTSDNKV